jgi:two-component system response regulator YesN
MKIMIVDDEEMIRLGIEKILSRMGLDIEIIGSYGNGLEAMTAIGKLKSDELDVLITDIKMPVMDGLKLLEKAKAWMPNLPAIVLSGFNDFEYARQALRYGVTDYFLKPLDKKELYEVLAKMKKQRSLAEDATHVEAGSVQQEHPIVVRVKHILDKEYDREFHLERLAEKVELSTSYVSKLFKQESGMTITDYLTDVRMEKAKQFLLDYPNMKNYEISSMVGYPDPVYFNKLFKRLYGLTPKEYRDGKKEA